MTVLISGATGLIGSALAAHLTAAGHTVVRLIRAEPRPDANEVRWNPAEGAVDVDGLDGVEAVVNLAGENIGQKWTPERKARMLDSRIKGTKLLAESITRMERPPAVFVSASATGYYGDRGDETLTEESPPGSGFLADLCVEWEGAAHSASEAGIRIVTPRFGVVISPKGGMLDRVMPMFRLGLGGRLGSGKQYLSWISIHDLVRIIEHVIGDTSLNGPVNAVSPNPVTNAEFTRVLGRVLGRPTLFTAPAAALRLAFGEMANEMLLSGQRVVPTKLLDSGFEFGYPDLEQALRDALGAR